MSNVFLSSQTHSDKHKHTQTKLFRDPYSTAIWHLNFSSVHVRPENIGAVAVRFKEHHTAKVLEWRCTGFFLERIIYKVCGKSVEMYLNLLFYLCTWICCSIWVHNDRGRDEFEVTLLRRIFEGKEDSPPPPPPLYSKQLSLNTTMEKRKSPPPPPLRER